jgi:glutamate 5-kinase
MKIFDTNTWGTIRLAVVKIGSKILTPATGNEHIHRISAHIQDMCDIIDENTRLVFISSGAVSHGRIKLGLPERPTTIPLKQACAGVGQIELLHMYNTLFDRAGIICGQILLTWDDLENKKRYNNLRNAIFTMLDKGIVPIINENDSVGVEEITFGDNDTLAAQVATVLNADIFITLTDINGLYSENPRSNPGAEHIPLVKKFTSRIVSMADAEGSDVGTGGMVTKLKAARMVTNAGMSALIGNGYDYSLREIIKNKEYRTLFIPTKKKMKAKKRYLAFTDTPKGCIAVDKGAFEAIAHKGKSLLPAGVTQATPGIMPGDTVDIVFNNTPFARGISNYSAESIEKIGGEQTHRINDILGGDNYTEVIHRNNMVVL